MKFSDAYRVCLAVKNATSRYSDPAQTSKYGNLFGMSDNPPMSSRRAECLARAEQFRTLAATATDATLVHSYTSLAASYDLLARFTDRGGVSIN